MVFQCERESQCVTCSYVQEFTATQLESLRKELAQAKEKQAAVQQRNGVCSQALQKLSEEKAQVELEREALFKKQNLQAKFSSKVHTMQGDNCSLVSLPLVSCAF
jgi:uncharacterized protein (DUF3084 family)